MILPQILSTINKFQFGLFCCRLLSTGKVLHFAPDSLGPNEKAGLILGVHTYDHDPSDLSFKLTSSAEKFDKLYGGKLSALLKVARPVPRLGKVKVFYGLDSKYIAVAIVGLGDDSFGYNAVEQLDEKKEAIRTAAAIGVRALEDLAIPKIYIESFDHAESSAEGACLASWLYQELRDVRNRKYIKKLELFDSCDITGWKIGLHKAAAQNLTRLLQETPGNNLTPCIFAQTTIEMLAKYGISVNVRMKNWAKLRNLNGFLAVAKGSCDPPVFLEILYEGCDPCVSPIVVIGKGTTFNSGGLCLKGKKFLQYGRGDMLGAAAVVATFRAIAALKLPINVLGLLPLCSNVPGASAYKPGDIIRSYNGKTILVESTACEGLILHADTLSFAQEYNPKFILNVGTIAPDMIGAMGETASGVFSNNDSLYEMMRIASIHTGDRIWRFPLWSYFEDYMTAEIGDLTNKVTKHVGGGACKSAAFLKNFVPEGVDWIHIDCYNIFTTKGTSYKYIKKGMSGRPTRNLIEFLAQLSCRES